MSERAMELLAPRVSRPEEAACVVCAGHSSRVVFRQNGYEARGCSCGAIYVSPLPPPQEVDPTLEGHPDLFYSLPAAMKVRWLARFRPAGRLLEVGCGEGHFAEAAIRYGYEVAGIEAHPARAARVRDRLGIPVECGTIEDASPAAADACFDVVFHCDLLSHFPDPVLALRRMTALLRPGGVLFFEVGLIGDLDPFWYRWIGDLDLPRHRWFYSEASLNRLLSAAGLRVERMKRFGLGPGVALFRTGGPARRLLRSLLTTGRRPGGPPAVGVESGARSRLANVMRYRVGAVVPWFGPQTTFVIARPGVDRAAS